MRCPFVAVGKGDHCGRNLLLTAGLWDRGARQRDRRCLDGGGGAGGGNLRAYIGVGQDKRGEGRLGRISRTVVGSGSQYRVLVCW